MEIVELGALIVVGMDVQTTFQGLWRAVPRAWNVLFDSASEIRHRVAPTFVDVRVEVVDGIHHQVVGAEVSAVDDPVPEGMRAIELPASRYVHHRHEGSITAIPSAFEDMIDWVRSERIIIGDVRIDRGYTRGFHERVHDLYLRIAE